MHSKEHLATVMENVAYKHNYGTPTPKVHVLPPLKGHALPLCRCTMPSLTPAYASTAAG